MSDKDTPPVKHQGAKQVGLANEKLANDSVPLHADFCNRHDRVRPETLELSPPPKSK